MALGSGLEPKWSDSCEDTTLCLFMEGLPENVDPANQCFKDAEWHLWYEPQEGQGDMTQACELHHSRARQWREVKHFHQFGAACNTPGSLWVQEIGRCLTLDTALELGYAWYVDEKGERLECPD